MSGEDSREDTIVVNFPDCSCVASNCSNWILICVPLISHLAPQPLRNLFHNREQNRHVGSHTLGHTLTCMGEKKDTNEKKHRAPSHGGCAACSLTLTHTERVAFMKWTFIFRFFSLFCLLFEKHVLVHKRPASVKSAVCCAFLTTRWQQHPDSS